MDTELYRELTILSRHHLQGPQPAWPGQRFRRSLHPAVEEGSLRRGGGAVNPVPYQVRVSSRAKYPRLKMSAREGLVVVVPDGFDESRIPEVVDGKREWIRRSEERLRDHAKFLMPQPPDVPPERISLRAIGEEWS